jgi:hypothetical protein
MASSGMQRTGELSEPPDDASHSERHAGRQRRPRHPWEGRSAEPGPVLGQWTGVIPHLALMAPEYASPACNRALQESMTTGRPWWIGAEKSSSSGDVGSPGN